MAFLSHTGPIVLEFPAGARDQTRPPSAFLDDNEAEGSSPLTVEALAARLTAVLART
ncbi:MAG: hypothetical protein KA371_15225 [Acidobacteria bacterium]|nr:hypothetical protein [Acidobacteriota bacterium]